MSGDIDLFRMFQRLWGGAWEKRSEALSDHEGPISFAHAHATGGIYGYRLSSLFELSCREEESPIYESRMCYTMQYRLDLKMVLETLLRHQLSGTLKSEVSAGPIEITIVLGKMTSCRFASYTGEDALQAVAKLGVLSWNFILASPTPTLTPFSPSPRVPIPTRTANNIPLSSLPRFVMRVYACIDGRASAQKIAGILNVPLERVEDALIQLQAHNLITFS